MEEKDEFNSRLTEFEQTLSRLTPLPARMNVAQAMFLAGQKSARRSKGFARFWPMISAGFAFSSLALSVLLFLPREPRIVYIERPPLAESDDSKASDTATPKVPDVLKNRARGRSTGRPAPLPRTQFGGVADYLKWRQLALNDVWAPPPSIQSDTALLEPRMVRRQDWKTILDEDVANEGAVTSDKPDSFNWRQLLQTKGS